MPSGGAVTNIRLATTDSWRDKQTGEQQDRTEWHRVVFFNRLAEVAAEYLRKGSQSTSKAESRHASGKVKTVKTATPPRSSPPRCRCWAGVGVDRAVAATMRRHRKDHPRRRSPWQPVAPPTTLMMTFRSSGPKDWCEVCHPQRKTGLDGVHGSSFCAGHVVS